MKRALSHIGHLAFLLLGLFLVFRGVEDFGLLLFGKITDATVLSVSTRSVRVGKRGRGTQHFAQYEFSLGDDQTYSGNGAMDAQTPREKGALMPIRYLSFYPSVNAPQDDVLGTGVLLTIIGAFLTFITIGAWRRKIGQTQSSGPPETTRKPRTA